MYIRTQRALAVGVSGKTAYTIVVLKMEVLLMCDVKKYSDIFEEIKKLNPDDTLQLVLESKTEEEKSFYEMIGDFLLQTKQKDSIARNVF